MNTVINFKVGCFGEIAKWENKSHPDNPNFMQVVFWYAFQNRDHVTIQYRLDNFSKYIVVDRLALNASDDFAVLIMNYVEQQVGGKNENN